MTRIASKLFNPCARSDDLIVEELGEELLIYDMKADRGHCLSPTAARVWRRCDGHATAEGLSAQLDLDPDAVDRALEELSVCKLLEPTPELTVVAANGGVTRREVATRFVKAGAVAAAAPLIVSVVAPTPAQAQTLLFCKQFESSQGCGQCQQNDCCCCEPAQGQGKRCVPDTAAGWLICCIDFGVGNVVFSSGCTNPGSVCEANTATTESTERQFEGRKPAPEPGAGPAPEPTPTPEATATAPEAPSPGTTTTPTPTTTPATVPEAAPTP